MRYWPNYGELVKEAGLEPNIFDKTKYTKEQLCELFISLIREKQKWPTRGDLDVKHNLDRAFPSPGTFYIKLGLTVPLINSILEYAERANGYEDISSICKQALQKYKHLCKGEALTKINFGYVYLGKQGSYYKIGKSKDYGRRREDINLLGAEPFEHVHVIKTDDMDGIEKYWHERFKDKRKRGEWFNLSVSDVKAFKRWKIA